MLFSPPHFLLTCYLDLKVWLGSLFLPLLPRLLHQRWFSLLLGELCCLVVGHPFWDASSLDGARLDLLVTRRCRKVDSGSSHLLSFHHPAQTKYVKLAYDFHVAKPQEWVIILSPAWPLCSLAQLMTSCLVSSFHSALGTCSGHYKYTDLIMIINAKWIYFCLFFAFVEGRQLGSFIYFFQWRRWELDPGPRAC